MSQPQSGSRAASPGAAASVSGQDRRLSAVLLCLALASGTVLMLPMFSGKALALDEYGTYWIAGDGPLSLWERSLQYENIPPLSPWLHRVFLDALGESEWSFRLPSLIWYLAAILMVRKLGSEFQGPVFGSLCALAAAWHPVILGEVRFARCYSLTLLLSTICYWSTIRWVRRPWEYLWAAVWAITAIALVWTHYLNAAVVGATLLVLLWKVAARNDRGRVFLAVALLLIVLCGSPLYEPFVRMSHWGEYFGFQASAPILETVSSFWWAGMPAGIAAALLVSRRHQRSPEDSRMAISRTGWIILLLWGMLPSLAAVIVCRGDFASLSNPRYRLGFEAASVCLMAALVTRNTSRAGAVVGVCIAILGAWLASSERPWIAKRLNEIQSEQWKAMAFHIRDHGHPDEDIFVQSGLGESHILSVLFEDFVLQDFAACRLGRFYLKGDQRRIGLPSLWHTKSDVVVYYTKLLQEIAAAPRKSFWLASATDTDLSISSAETFSQMALEAGFSEVGRVQYSHALAVRFSIVEQRP